jgi:ABC-type amino acid transport substrate-binding protein
VRGRWCAVRAISAVLFCLLSTSASAHYVKLNGELLEKNTFTVGIALAGKPFSYRENGELKGFEIAMAQAVADAHGLQLKTLKLPHAELIAALEQRKVDAINTLPIPALPQPLQQLPYLVIGDHVMILRGNPFRIHTLEDLSGRIASATSGSTAEEFGNQINENLRSKGLAPMDIHTFLDQRHTHFPVSMGHAAAYFIQTLSAVGISQDPESRTELVPGLFRPLHEVGFAVLSENSNIHHAIEHAIAAMVATGKYRQLLEQYRLPEELSPFR